MGDWIEPKPPRQEIITRFDLPDEQLEDEAREVVAVLQSRGVTDVEYACSDGHGLIPVMLIVPVVSGTATVILESWRGNYGTMDQTFRVLGEALEFEFCHEAQLHVRAEDEELLRHFWSRWMDHGYAFGWRTDKEWDWDLALTPGPDTGGKAVSNESA